MYIKKLIPLMLVCLLITSCTSVVPTVTTKAVIEEALEVTPVKITTCGNRTSLTQKHTGSGC